MRSPPGYERVEGRAGWAFALPEARDRVREVLAAGLTLRSWAAGHPEALVLRGRGAVHVVPAPHGRWVVRPYRRGGAVAGPLLGDRFPVGPPPRPVAEAVASAEVRRRGIPTPRVVAGAVYPAGLFYRADLVTEYVPDTSELAEILFGARGREQETRTAALVEAGRLLARLARAGLEHADLNARNILLGRPPDRHARVTRGTPAGDAAAPRALLLDLDRCRVGREGVPLSPARMLARLERSLEKIGGRSDRPLDPAERARLRAAVAGVP